MINTIWITIICVLIIDQTDAIDSLKRLLSRVLTTGKVDNSNYSLKPIDCSLCSSWWLNLVYIAATGHFTLLNITIILLLAVATPIINDAITLTMTALQRIISLLDNILQ